MMLFVRADKSRYWKLVEYLSNNFVKKTNIYSNTLVELYNYLVNFTGV